MEPITIEQLYKNYEILSDAKDKIAEVSRFKYYIRFRLQVKAFVKIRFV